MGLATATMALAIPGAGDAGTCSILPGLAIFSFAVASVTHQQVIRRG